MTSAIHLLLLVLGLLVLVKGADFLVDGAAAVARRLGVTDLVIGLTVVAFGTSTPELFVNIFASLRGNVEIAIGNVLGSNIANILLILGLAAMIFPLEVGKGTVWKEIPFSLLAVVVLGLLANDRLIDGETGAVLSRSDGMVLLAFFAIFLYYTYAISGEIEGSRDESGNQPMGIKRAALCIAIGLAGLVLGGKWIVDSAVWMARFFGVGESLIGLTVVAVGTSLPELATSCVAAYKRNVDIAVGNVVGSNIFNIFFVLGVSASIKPLPFAARSNIDILAVTGASLLLFLAMFTGKRRAVDRWEGAVFLLLYALYVAFLIWQA